MSVVHGKGKVYRVGGEEIAIILKNYSVDEAITVAERARRYVEETPIDGGRVRVKCSMSFGVACSPDHAATAKDLHGAADRALYDAKHYGRNLVRVHGEPAPTPTRVPTRKVAESGRLTAQQKSEFRSSHLRGEIIRCPSDAAIFKVTPAQTLGSTASFFVSCPNCGLSEQLVGDPL